MGKPVSANLQLRRLTVLTWQASFCERAVIGVMTESSNEGTVTPKGLEIRVHGIGDHDLLSALGSPTVLSQGKKRGATVARPPEGVDHDLILVNWSRMSRRPFGSFLWYLAFPFTLVNVAFEMRPLRGWRRNVHVGALTAWSLILTGVTACWAIALSESIFRFVDLPDEWRAHRLGLAVSVGAGTLILVMLVRAWNAESKTHVVSGVVHACVVSLIALGALSSRPGEWRVDDYSWVRFFAVQGPTNEQITSGTFDLNQLRQTPLWLDPVGLVSYLALALSLLAALILLATWVRSEQGPASGAAFAVLLSGVLTVLITSSVHAGVTQLVGRSSKSIPVLGGPDSMHPAGALMSRLGRSYPTTLLPGVGLALLLLLVLSLCYWVFRLRMLSWFPPKRHRAEFLRWAHEKVENLPQTLMFTAAFFVLLAMLLGFALFRLFEDREYEGLFCSPYAGPDCLPGYINAIGWLATGSTIAAFFVVRKANSLPALRNTLASAADVAGFWPITLHPLGARTYRVDAMEGITTALQFRPDQRRVLVGHSQGSVLAAWTVAEQSEPLADGTRPALVTCGSPLGSLYFTFFPRPFDVGLFNRIVSRSSSWTNFWRPTDPIATAFVGRNENAAAADERNKEITDPPGVGEQVRGHSDYWIAAQQLSWVGHLLTPPPTTPSSSVPESSSADLGPQ